MIPFLLFVSLLLTASQACPLTDTYLSRCHCGILTNGESYIKCDEKTLDRIPAFKRSFPYDELILSNNNIETLPRSAFDNIKTIKRVNLENNSLSFIDDDLLRLLGNYLEELILTGDGHLSSLEFLVRYPLKNLRVLKLNQFDLSSADFRKLFRNMTKLEVVSLRACQIKRLPVLPNVQVLDLENNQIANSISLSASYTHLNLARNFVTSIRLPANSPLRTLNLSENSLSSFDFSLLNANLTSLNLNANRLLAVSLNSLPESLTSLSLSHNLIKQIKIAHKQQFSLSSLDLSYNQLRTIEVHPLFDQLEELHLNNNPLECTCHLTWLQKLAVASKRINASTWTCLSPKPCSFLSSDFQCVTKQTSPRVLRLNISYVKISTDNGLFIQWNVRDDDKILTAIQISISEPFYLSPKLRANQTEIFLANQIQPNKRYHICLILSHKYARDKYCREFLTDQLVVLLSNEIVIDKPSASLPIRNFDMNVYMMLIGSCLGGILTFLLIFLCCYLCFQIHQTNARRKNAKNLYYSRNVTAHYPVYQSHSATCPYHHHENLSNSTDSSQMDGSLSTTNLKHIYQTIDSQEYSNLKHDNQLFDLWNESLRQKR